MTTIMRSLFPSKRRKTDDRLSIDPCAVANPQASSSATSPVTRSQLHLNNNNSTSAPSTSASMRIAKTSSSSSSAASSATSPPSTSTMPHQHYTRNPGGPPSRKYSTRGSRPPANLPNGAKVSNKERRLSNMSTSKAPFVYSELSNSLCARASHILSPEDLRLVLLESESRCLFDSATVIPVKKPMPQSTVKAMSSCNNFQFLRKRKDVAMMAQMLFGAMPSTTGSESFKIHTLIDEKKLLISKVFTVPKASREGTSSDSDTHYNNTVKSLDALIGPTRSTTALPETFSRVRNISLTLVDDVEDDAASTVSRQNSATLPRTFSPHRMSRNRRRSMAQKTSLSESTTATSSSWKSRSRLSSCCSQTDDESYRQVGLGLVFSLGERSFLFQHMPILEAEMSRLESRVVLASGHPPSFLVNVSKAWEELVETICNLHNAPRIRRPVWLSLTEKAAGGYDKDHQLAQQFCTQLAHLIKKLDTKENGFFLSNLITTVLMHHMSWVASVAAPPFQPEHRESQYKRNHFIGTNLNDDAPSLGYNAHLAQFLELTGNSGPHKTAKVICVGDDDELLSMLCFVLSYFVRCSVIRHKDSHKCWELPREQAFSPTEAPAAPTSPELGVSPPAVDHHFSRPATPPPVAIICIPDKSEPLVVGIAMETDMYSPSCSVDSLPSMAAVHATTTSITVVTESGTNTRRGSITTTTAVTIIDRFELSCCHTDDEDDDDDVKPLNDDEMWSPDASQGLGRSLFAGPVPFYCPHFAVSGILKSQVNMADTFVRIVDEVRSEESVCQRVASSSQSLSCASEAQLPEKVLIVADVNEMTVKVVSTNGTDTVPSPSEAVVLMMEQFAALHKVNCAPRFLISSLEDSLIDIYRKSNSLVEMVCRDPTDDQSTELSPERMLAIIGCDYSDLRLIVNVAAAYYPSVLSSVFGH